MHYSNRVDKFKKLFNTESLGINIFFHENKEHQFYRYKDISIRLDTIKGECKLNAYKANFKDNTFDLFLVSSYKTEEDLDRIMKFIVEGGEE